MFKINDYKFNLDGTISLPIENEELLLTGKCHVDHEGFDLNEIEIAYYKANGYDLYHDNTFYKDGGKESGSNAILQTWVEPIDDTFPIILDHSHYVIRYEFVGPAKEQILKYVKRRPELLRLLSARRKYGLDFCIDYFNLPKRLVYPVVHIEWDYNDKKTFDNDLNWLNERILSLNWVKLGIDMETYMQNYTYYNSHKKLDAFTMADARARYVFATPNKAYQLIPTL